MRVTKDPLVRKKEILDAAIRIFSEKGYEKTSIADIARSIQVAQGLCYRYFPSKEDLFEAALEEYADQIIINMQSKLNGKEMNISDIVSNAYPSSKHEEDAAYGLFHGEKNCNLHDKLLWKVCQKLVPIVKGYLEVAQEKKEIEVPDIDSAASFCVYGQLGILLMKDMDETKKGELITAFLRYMLHM